MPTGDGARVPLGRVGLRDERDGQRLLLTLAIAAWIALLTGCHTMDGLGQDIEQGGQKIQDKANK